MYECQGTLVRRGRGECLLAQGDGGCLSYMLRRFRVAVSSRPSLCPSFLAISADKQMEAGCVNDKKMDWVHRTGGKQDCFANEVGKCGCGPLGGRVSATMLCHPKVSISSCRLLYFLRLKSQFVCFFEHVAIVASLWAVIAIKCPGRADPEPKIELWVLSLKTFCVFVWI